MLKKASKAHAGQAKTLDALELKKGGRVKKKSLKAGLMKLVTIQNPD